MESINKKSKLKIIIMIVTTITVIATVGIYFLFFANSFSIETEEISIYIGQKFDINDYLKYSSKSLQNIKATIVDGEIDILKSGTYNVNVEAVSESKRKNKKEIKVIVKDFANAQEVCDYANNIIAENNYTHLKATKETGERISIGNISFNQSNVKLTFKIRSDNALVPRTGVSNILTDSNDPILSKKWYFVRVLADIYKNNVPLDTNNWYSSKSIIISSNNGIYEFDKNIDSMVIADHERSNNHGTIFEPKYDMTSNLGYNLYDIDKLNTVLSGDNMSITLVLAKGLLDEDLKPTGEEEKITVSLNDEQKQVLKEIIDFSQNFFCDDLEI